MYEFHKRALFALLCLAIFSALVAYTCVRQSHLILALFPTGESTLPWRAAAVSDAAEGGASTVQVVEGKSRLAFRFHIKKSAEYPFAAAEMRFEDRSNKPALVDLSRYTSISFKARCSPANTLTVAIPTFDPKISSRSNLLSYRTPSAFFSCGQRSARVELDLTHLETPQWWFDMFKLDLSHQAYKLDQVPKISFGTTFQSPTHLDSSAEMEEVTLHGRDFSYLYFLGIFLAIVWSGYGVWFVRRHTQVLIAEVKDKLQRDLPLVAYQQLSMEPHKDKEKATILRFIATNYARPDLDLETLVGETGINRNKINEILKSELGFTFSGYLNKLRLTEAARLLAEKESASIAEIAYSVGYGNASYFNKLFKEEYDCTPKVFRDLSRQ
jgi:AraC-like DNA-binding protein